MPPQVRCYPNVLAGRSRKYLAAALAAGVAAALGVGLAGWQRQALTPDTGSAYSQAPRGEPPSPAAPGMPTLPAAPLAVTAASGPAAPPLMQIDGAHWRQRGYDGLVNPDLGRLFEQILGRTEDAQLAQQWLAAQLPAAERARAADLLERYRRYRAALAEMPAPAERGAGSVSDMGGMPHAAQLAQIVQQREALQREYFAADDVQRLFADDNHYDHYTIGRLQLLERSDLTLAQKEAAEQRLARQWLSDEQRQVRAEAALPHVISQQNAVFAAQQLSAAKRQAQRSAEFGVAAAQRMAQVDAEQQAWQARIAAYAAASEEQQQRLRLEAFSASERLRLDGALALYRERQGQ